MSHNGESTEPVIVRANTYNVFALAAALLEGPVYDYGRRSRDPANAVDVLRASAAAIALGMQTHALWVALLENRPVAYLLAAIVDNPLMGGTYMTPLQLWVQAGKMRMREFLGAIREEVLDWMRSHGVARVLATSYRSERAYERLVGSIGFRPAGTIYSYLDLEVPGDGDAGDL